MMKKVLYSVLSLAGAILFFYATTAFIISDPKADYHLDKVNLETSIALSSINSKNSKIGAFKSQISFKNSANQDLDHKEFYGYKVAIANNPKVDHIYIGICNNLISRVEVWNNDSLIESKELGFMSKMTWGDLQKMSIEYHPQKAARQNPAMIQMRFNEYHGFFGDIGSISLDLSNYGDFEGDKSLALFTRSPNTLNNPEPEFSNLMIWKDYQSYD